MKILKRAMMKFIRAEEGLTIVEYAVAGALISLAVYTAFDLLGDRIVIVIDGLRTAIGG